ncbi:hypothetical protein M8818_000468 [Zalaria obscura]|uniref:Uncharacterized protein n=1 Tax=Zalaria obscura TaxID=2024903 RepID=A0ACC3SPR9_9PEZI
MTFSPTNNAVGQHDPSLFDDSAFAYPDFGSLLPTSEALYPSDHGMRPTHIDPASMWAETGKLGMMQGQGASDFMGQKINPADMDDILGDRSATVKERFGQITPPDEILAGGYDGDPSKGVEPSYGAESDVDEVGRTMASRKRSSTSGKSPPKKQRKDSKALSVKEEDDNEVDGDDKKEKYREKNRVAAAKCRAKKKENVDQLEDTYRTQSALNSALKQTEKSLRDELSHWRTQALQHTFCNCRPIQEYNLRKARNLAADGGFGSYTAVGRSPSLSSSSVAPSPRVNYRHRRDPMSQSLSGQTFSPVSSDVRRASLSLPNRSVSLGLGQEQEMKTFVNDDEIE